MTRGCVDVLACLLERPWTVGHEVCSLVQSDGAGAGAGHGRELLRACMFHGEDNRCELTTDVVQVRSAWEAKV